MASREIIGTALVLLALAAPAQTSNPFEQRLAWTRSPSHHATGYVLYITTNGWNATNWTRVPVTNVAWTNVVGEITNGWLKTNFVSGVTNWLRLTSYDTEFGIESVPTTNEVRFVPPPPPGTLRLLLQVSPSVNGPWRTLTNAPPVDLPMTEQRLFSRIVHQVF